MSEEASTPSIVNDTFPDGYPRGYDDYLKQLNETHNSNNSKDFYNKFKYELPLNKIEYILGPYLYTKLTLGKKVFHLFGEQLDFDQQKIPQECDCENTVLFDGFLRSLLKYNETDGTHKMYDFYLEQESFAYSEEIDALLVERIEKKDLSLEEGPTGLFSLIQYYLKECVSMYEKEKCEKNFPHLRLHNADIRKIFLNGNILEDLIYRKYFELNSYKLYLVHMLVNNFYNIKDPNLSTNNIRNYKSVWSIDKDFKKILEAIKSKMETARENLSKDIKQKLDAYIKAKILNPLTKSKKTSIYDYLNSEKTNQYNDKLKTYVEALRNAVIYMITIYTVMSMLRNFDEEKSDQPTNYETADQLNLIAYVSGLNFIEINELLLVLGAVTIESILIDKAPPPSGTEFTNVRPSHLKIDVSKLFIDNKNLATPNTSVAGGSKYKKITRSKKGNKVVSRKKRIIKK
jgi:hypothetical protein